MADRNANRAFDLLHPLIKEPLYDMRWTELRPIQVDAIHAVIEGSKHIIISANTAGGKTEAAFLPVLSKIVDDHSDGVRALYVGPLKALINDQFRRLEDLCERSGIPVHKWHGDVGQSAKRDLLKSPSGVLLITPESIESLFINHPEQLAYVFGRLSYIVIDELHSFVGTERGAHLKSLIYRLNAKSREHVRFIGLSATLGDPYAAANWLCPGTEPILDESGKTIKYIIRGYLRSPANQHDGNAEDCKDVPVDVEETPDDTRLASDIIKAFYGNTALIFANSRALLEFYTDIVNRSLQCQGMQNLFRIHHGSLSKAEREDTEEELRSDRPTATFCSSTLELGIDVGNVSATGQIGAPWSVSSLSQRLGRSGRRENEASIMQVFIEDDEPTDRSSIIERLFPELLQAIAMTELMLEKWCEPPDVERLHLSTLMQQIMSVIAEKGGANAASIFETLITKGGFNGIDQAMFAAVLRGMGASDLIEQTPEGDLVLGLHGERIVRKFDFYSAFVTSKEYQVIHKGHLIGNITAPPGMGADGYIILAGRRWKILDIDTERQEIIVEPSRGGRLPYFYSAPGADIHPKVRKKMLEMLHADTIPSYLDSKAKEMLAFSKMRAKAVGILEYPIFKNGQDVVWFTWTGSKINRTLVGIGRYHLGLNVRDEGIALAFEKATESDIIGSYATCLESCPSAIDLANYFPAKAYEKYEPYLSNDLQTYLFAKNSLDLDGAMSIIKNVL